MTTVVPNLDALNDLTKDAFGNVKPKARGWIHAVFAPLVLASGIVLVIHTNNRAGRIATGVFAATSLLLFTMSAVYHRGHWSLPVLQKLQRIDHCNIFLLIAGTYTPLAALLLPPATARTVLLLAWGAAIFGLVLHLCWMTAPRMLFALMYVFVGCIALMFIGTFWRFGGSRITALIAVGGAAYVAGAIVYGCKRPNISLRWFGFHELMHALTVVGFTCHSIAIYLAVWGHTAS